MKVQKGFDGQSGHGASHYVLLINDSNDELKIRTGTAVHAEELYEQFKLFLGKGNK